MNCRRSGGCGYESRASNAQAWENCCDRFAYSYPGMETRGWHVWECGGWRMALKSAAMYGGLLLAFGWCAAGVALEVKQPAKLQGKHVMAFKFAPVRIGDKQALHVDVRFYTDGPVTTLLVPTAWGSATHLEGQTQHLRVVTAGASLEPAEPGAAAGERLLHARAAERVELEYDLVPLQTEWFHAPQEHMAIVNADYFLFNPANALVRPEIEGTEMVDASFDWRAMPKGTALFSSFGVGQREQRVRVPWSRVQGALFAGGNFRTTQSAQNGTGSRTRLVLAARGTWKFSDAQAFAQIRRVIDEENRFWGTQPMARFLVTLAPFDDKAGDDDGSGFTDAYMLFLSHEDTLDAERIELLAHEMFHHWNPMSMEPGAGDDSMEWFTEGFTVYYEAAIPLRAGLIAYADALHVWNEELERYERSPLRTATNAAWMQVSHASGDGQELPYAKGTAVALWADAAIRNRSSGKSTLDDVMRVLVSESQRGKAPKLDEERVLAAFGKYLAPEQVAQLRAMTIDGATVPLPERLGACAVLQHGEKTVVVTGFDEEKSYATKHMVGVVEGGAAYRAGARDGQELFRYSIYKDDPTKPVVLGVVIDGKRQVLQYSPAQAMALEQYAAAADADVRECTPFFER
jgi:predicted metalloprotease with PDZ domain